ncbi:hypothetical protein XfCFBP8356_008995 [Xylella fastidiosa subsp. sandyi]
MERKYLAVFVLPPLADAPAAEQAEFAQIIKLELNRAADGDFTLAFASDRCIAYLLTSKEVASNMTIKLPRSVKWLVTEIGESFAHQEMDAAGRWLWNRRNR